MAINFCLSSKDLLCVFWVVGLERGPFSLVSTTEELLRRKSSSSGVESRECGCRDPSRWLRGTFYPQKLALTSPTSGGRPVGTVRSWTQATELSLLSSRRYTKSIVFCEAESYRLSEVRGIFEGTSCFHLQVPKYKLNDQQERCK
jgi:hypothetical protein